MQLQRAAHAAKSILQRFGTRLTAHQSSSLLHHQPHILTKLYHRFFCHSNVWQTNWIKESTTPHFSNIYNLNLPNSLIAVVCCLVFIEERKNIVFCSQNVVKDFCKVLFNKLFNSAAVKNPHHETLKWTIFAVCIRPGITINPLFILNEWLLQIFHGVLLNCWIMLFTSPKKQTCGYFKLFLAFPCRLLHLNKL